jgi:hypothetical protein
MHQILQAAPSCFETIASRSLSSRPLPLRSLTNRFARNGTPGFLSLSMRELSGLAFAGALSPQGGKEARNLLLSGPVCLKRASGRL